MSWTAQGSLIQATASTFTLTPNVVGELILIEVVNISSNTVYATGLSSSNATWSVAANYLSTGAHQAGTCVIFAGVATSTTPQTVTVTWSGTAPASIRIAGRAFTATSGKWLADAFGTVDSAGTSTWPSLSAGQDNTLGEMYWGYCINTGIATAGSTPGYTYETDAHSNGEAFNVNIGNSPSAPVWGDSTQVLGAMIVMREIPATELTETITGQAGTDGYGNPYLEGFTVYQSLYNYIQMHVNAANGVPAIEMPTGAWTEENHASVYVLVGNKGQFNENIVAWLYGPSSTFDDKSAAVALTSAAQNGSTEAAGELIYFSPAEKVVAYWDGNGLHINSPGGAIWSPDVSQTDTTTKTNANAAGQDITVGWTIPANDAKVGTVYEIEFDYDGTFENQTLAFETSFDANARAEVTIGSGFLTAGSTFNGTIRLKIVVTATGASGTANFFLDGGFGILAAHSSGSNNNNAYLNARNTAEPFDTTVAHVFKGVSIWGGSTAGQTVSSYGSVFTRKGP